MARSSKKAKVVSARFAIHVGKQGDSHLDFPEVVANMFRRHVTFRVLVIELPLFLLLLLAVLCHELLYFHGTYLHKYMRMLTFTPERKEWEETYPRMECEISDLTALEPSNLVLQRHETFLDATEKVLLHGALVLPQLLKPETAYLLRKYIQKRNRKFHKSDHIAVIMNENRISLTLSATEHPSVTNALMEIGNNKRFVDMMEALLGPDPSLVEFQTITVTEGAEPQFFHADTPPRSSAIMNHHTFTPLYTLLIPLQDTSSTMGPTAVCPGSHRCYFTRSCYGFGSDHGDNLTEQVGFQIVGNSTGIWEAGSGLIYSSSTQHRGTGHTKGPHRVVLILSFTSRPDYMNKPSLYSRFPPLDSVYGIRWHQMGHSLSDLVDPASRMSLSLTRWTGLIDSEKLAWTSFRFDVYRAANPDQYRFRVEALKEQKDHMKGLMGTLSTILLVEVEPPPRNSEYSDTEYHVIKLLNRLRFVSMILFGAAVGFYLSWLGPAPTSRLRWTLVRLSAMGVVIYGLVQAIRVNIDQSTWAADIMSGSVAYIPPESPAQVGFVDKGYSMNLPTPKVQDILVDSLPLHLAAHAYILDYLPGNRWWRSSANAQSKFYLLYDGLPAPFREAVIENVISMTKTNGARNFYEKNEIGDFVEMPDASIRRKTRNLILEHVLHPNKRLGYITDNIRCARKQGSRTLCQLKPKVACRIFECGMDSLGLLSAPKPQDYLLFGRKSKLKIPLQSTQTCAPRDKGPTSTWDVGDMVQVQLNRTSAYRSRKWVNAEIIKVRRDGLYDLESFNVDIERAFGVEPSLLRSPQQWKPDFRALRSVSFTTKSGPASMASCKLTAFDLVNESGCDRSSLTLDSTNSEMARSYIIPDGAIGVQIVFDFTEVSSRGGNVFVRLRNSDLHIGSFDPATKESIESGYFSDIYAGVEAVDATKNTVTLSVPDGWIVDNRLVFGVRVEGGIAIHIGGKIVVSAMFATARVEELYHWEPVYD